MRSGRDLPGRIGDRAGMHEEKCETVHGSSGVGQWRTLMGRRASEHDHRSTLGASQACRQDMESG